MNHADNSGFALLFAAAQNGAVKAVRALLEAEATVSHASNPSPPVHCAVYWEEEERWQLCVQLPHQRVR